MIRHPVVAGSFYPSNPRELQLTVEKFLAREGVVQKESALGIVSPHAGYMYSGHVAGRLFSQVKIPKKIILLGPNHTGQGAMAAIHPEGYWQTPLGKIAIDSHLALRLLELCPGWVDDLTAHLNEHSLEVQLPFLQVLKPDLSIVPICLSHLSFANCEALATALASCITESPDEILMLASSDMNHYESQEQTLAKDNRAIECILDLDPPSLYQRVHEEHISMCGIIPTTVMLLAAKQLGAKKTHLVSHATSGDMTGDFSGVVGYAGIYIS